MVYLSGVTFAGQRVTPSDDGEVRYRAMTDGFLNGCAIGNSGLNITVGAGRLIACGREVRIDSAVSVPVTASNTYVRVKLVLDLSAPTAEQAALDVDYATTTTSFPALARNDLNAGGTVYEMPLCIYSFSGGSIYGKSWSIRRAHAKSNATQVDIEPTAWNETTTAKIWEKMADPVENVICTPDPSCRQAWIDAGVYLDSLTVGVLQFKCTTVPSTTLTANLLWL